MPAPVKHPRVLEEYLNGKVIEVYRNTEWVQVIPYSEPIDVWGLSGRRYTFRIQGEEREYDNPVDRAGLVQDYLEGKTIQVYGSADPWDYNLRVYEWKDVFPYEDALSVHRLSNPEYQFRVK